jgi:branched-chain amino acid transport system ATP-binding protein
MLSVNKVSFFYEDVQILTDVSLQVNNQEWVAIFGPNGHGKSTLLKVICGLLKPASGSVEYEGDRIDRLSAREIVNRGIVYVPEDRHLFPQMSVLENLKMGAFSRNARARESDNLEFVFQLFPKLERLSKQKAYCLSGGEGRMLAIGRGLMSNPRFVAIDEPSFGLAPSLRVDVFKAIDEIRDRGVTVLVVEQSTTIASEYADRMYVIEDGKIAFQGDREKTLSNDYILETYLGVANGGA